MRIKLPHLFAGLTMAGIMGLAPAEAQSCTTEQTCASTNRYGAQLVGINDVEYHEGTNCLEQWDCQYADGFQTRHFGIQPE